MTKRAMLSKDHPCRSCDVSAEALCRALDVETLADFRNQGGRLHLTAGQIQTFDGMVELVEGPVF